MQKVFFSLVLMVVLMVAGCSRPWVNPDIPDATQADYQFDKDSTDCGIVASEQYPLDQDRQLPIYKKCMESKGWILKDPSDGIPLRK